MDVTSMVRRAPIAFAAIFVLTFGAIVYLVSSGKNSSANDEAQSSAPPAAAYAQVDQQRLSQLSYDDGDWPSYGRDWNEQRFSNAGQINASTVKRLKPVWYADLDTRRGQEATPLVIDGVMYTSTAWSKVVAVDAVTGEMIWQFDPQVPGEKAVHACCDVVNRGVAAWKGKIFVGTIDGRLIAIDAKTGEEIWSVETFDPELPYSITGAPRVFKDKVVIGNGGAEFGVRGYVSAYDTQTGEMAWRFYTVPGNPENGADGAASDDVLEQLAAPTWTGEWWELGGGGTVWDSIVYDPDYDQVLLGVGNGSPWNHRRRSEGEGDNLFLASIVAVDADTGKYKWHYQANPGETWDFTNTQQIMLATLDLGEGDVKVLMQAPKNGFFFVIDRANGRLLSAEPYVEVNWASGYDLTTGRPIEAHGARFEEMPFDLRPSGVGGHSWMPMSYSPQSGLVYIPTLDLPIRYSDDEDFEIKVGRWNTGVGMGPAAGEDGGDAPLTGSLTAWDPVRQKAAWKHEYNWVWNGGTLATGGDLVFQGGGDGVLHAFDALTGEELWQYQTGRGIIAAPISYSVNGKQYIAIVTGYGGAVGLAWPYPYGDYPMPSGRIVAFALDGEADLPPTAASNYVAPPVHQETISLSPAELAAAEANFIRLCAVCHSGSVTPDLTRTALLSSKDAWFSVVRDGALEANGMASFADYLSPDEADAIRQYLLSKNAPQTP